LFGREYQIRARRSVEGGKLKGEQQRLAFPQRGRPSRFRVLERCGQMRLELTAPAKSRTCAITASGQTERNACQPEDLDTALQMTFPVGPMTEDELTAEFHRLFPLE
jgi:hypothetical protein